MMENGTEDYNVTGYPFIYITVMRVNSLAIFIENLIVAVCLYTHKNTFSRREFWLHLVCLNINDILVGISLLLLSFINAEVFNKSLKGCALLMVVVVIPQLTLPYNVLSICVYRFTFLIFSDKRRFGWKTKMTVFQIVGIHLFSAVYTIVPFIIWTTDDHIISNCSPVNVFGPNRGKAFGFIGAGILLPLIVLNILYCVTFQILRRHMMKRLRILRHTENVTKTLHQSDVVSTSGEAVECHRTSVQLYRPYPGTSDILSSKLCHTKSRHVRFAGNLRGCESDCNYDNETDVDNRKDIRKTVYKEIRQLQIKGNENNACLTERNGKYNQTLENIEKLRSRDSTPSVACNNLLKTDLKLKCGSSRKLNCPIKRSIVYQRNDYQRQSLVLIGIILLLIDVTTFPSVFVRIIPGNASVMVNYIFALLTMNNSLFNPWVYALHCNDFRAALRDNIRKVFSTKCCRVW